MSVHIGNNNLMRHCNSCMYCRQDKCFFSNPVKINLQLVHVDQGAEKVFGCFVRQQAAAESWWVGEH